MSSAAFSGGKRARSPRTARVSEQKFDGFEDGVLLEAKEPGYAEFFEGGLAPKHWFRDSGKAQDLIDQAMRQRDRVRGMGIPIEWHVAEKHAADAMRKVFKDRGIVEVTVIHTPAL